jgi:hypothetical protein
MNLAWVEVTVKEKSKHRLKSQTVLLQGDAMNASSFNPARKRYCGRWALDLAEPLA